jgi:hypothetical protein
MVASEENKGVWTEKILARNVLTTDGVWIGNRIY